jgi:CRISPR-associated protein Csm2
MMRGGQSVSDAQLQQILADVPKILNDPKTADVLVKRADELGQRLVNERLRMAQARDIFDELRQIESIWLREPERALRRLHLLRPKLAYRRARVRELGTLADVLDKALAEVVSAPNAAEKHDRFRRLMEFMEAIVAYHKFYGGGD